MGTIRSPYLSRRTLFGRRFIPPTNSKRSRNSMRRGYPRRTSPLDFGIEPGVVIRRLKLAAVSAHLMREYRDGHLTLEQLMAFTISDDHALQEQVWSNLPSHDRDPRTIRRALSRSHVRGSERNARFVGAKAYEEAGGVIVRDLFDTDDEGYFTDAGLLERLTREKLEAAAKEARADGWAWVEAMPEMDYGYLSRFRRLGPTPVPLTPEEEGKLEELVAKHDALIEELDDDASEEATVELDRLSAEIDAISEGQETWSAEDKARSGLILSISPMGTLSAERGLLKAEEGDVEEQHAGGAESDVSSQPKAPKDRLAYSDSLIEDLTAHKTAALREVVAGKPKVALIALVYAMAVQTFFADREATCVGVQLSSIDLRPSAEGIAESKAVQAMAVRHEGWLRRLPELRELWPWCVQRDLDTHLELLAYCTATTINAVRKRYDRVSQERDVQAHDVAQLAAVDMCEWWEPTRERFLSRVSKMQIAAAITEVVSEKAAQDLLPLKKEAMIVRASELLAGKRWLPTILRTPCVDPTDTVTADESSQ